MARFSSAPLKVLLLVAGAALYANTAFAVPAIWEAQLGATVTGPGPLTLVPALDGEDDADTNANLTFGSMRFPFAGATYTGGSILNISSNGFITLGGDNGHDCCEGDPALLIGDTFARIAPFWTNLDPRDEGGDVFINRFNDDGDSAIDRIVITFATGHDECNSSVVECFVLAQVQLLEDGTIIFGYNGFNLTNVPDTVSSDLLVGISPANLVGPPPASTDLSVLVLPFDSGTEETIYELFTAPPAPLFDLNDKNVIFTPKVGGGFTINDPSAIAAPVSTQPPIWETRIGATVDGQALDNEDDGITNLNFGTMVFPFAGTDYTGTTSPDGTHILNISTNGFISLGGNNGADILATPATLTSDIYPRIAPFWTDLNFRNTDDGDGGGDVFINRFDDDLVPDGIDDRIVITFAGGHIDCNAADCHVLVQVQLLDDGKIIFGYNGIDLLNPTNDFENDVLVGISPANGASNPGGSDFGNTAPFDSATEDTIYELFEAASAPPFDLDGGNLVFTRNGGGGFVVTAPGVSASAIGGGTTAGGRDHEGHCSLGRKGAAIDPTLWLLALLAAAYLLRRRVRRGPGHS